jgi:multiple sugar transport system substrate-binding protein
MRKKILNLVTLLAVFSLLLTACGAPAATPTPAKPTDAPKATGAPQPTAAPTAAAAPTEAAPATTAPVASGKPVEIRWYIGLGTGDAPELEAPQQKVVDAFNASHPNIHLTKEVVLYANAYETLATQVTSGNPPDIVGPVGVSGAEGFHGLWLDLAPYIQKNNYDLSDFDKSAVDFYKVGGEGQVGIPYAIYPSMVFYQKSMFDEAGLNYPPKKVGEKYKWPDGTESEWNYDTLKKVAMKLTVDEKGKTADQPGFDPKKIAQYGFVWQGHDDARAIGSYFGAGSLVGPDGKTAQIPPEWDAAWKWTYDSIWKDHFQPDYALYQSEAWGATNPFNSGKIAMGTTFLWYTCCMDNAGDKWDIAVVPSYNGKTTANLNADTFRIFESTKHPDEAFEVLQYLLGDTPDVKELLTAYGAFPARKSLQASFVDDLNKKFPQKPDWQVAMDSVAYADNPSFEAYFPNYNEALNRSRTFYNLILTTDKLNMDDEIAKFKNDLQVIFNKK